MSNTGSPGHRSTGGFDGTAYFDPDFTVEISNKMRVPSKISVAPDDNQSRNEHNMDNARDNNDWMRVPERILVAGGDKYASGRPPPPEMKLESLMHGNNFHSEPVQLMTPPRHLTLNDHQYPTVEPENDLSSSEAERKYYKTPTKDVNFSPVTKDFYGLESPQDIYSNSVYGNNSLAGADDLTIIKRQVKALNRKLAALERENQQKYQRDVILYTLGIVYFVFKGFSWLNRRW
ncbi:Transport and Golgi organization protein 11 [Halotydeus destructor]|nr:Transport and Golgi organization protein 11 [Halotydeus destructor]